ncbi:MAG: M24 family metallopeptidase [Armatimonadota bacterium]
MPRARKMVNDAAFQAAVDQSGVDAVVTIHPKTLHYMTGYPMALSPLIHQRPSSPRSGIGVFPRSAPPYMIVGGNEERVTREISWVEDLVVYGEYRESPMKVLADSFAKRGLGDGTLGVEIQYLSALFWDELKSYLPKARFVPWDVWFEVVRAQKTSDEVDLLRRNARLMDEAFIETFKEYQIGMTEKSVQDLMLYNLLKRGATDVSGIVQAGQENFAIHRWTNHPIRKGQIICTDFSARFDGYYANLSRVFIVGKPSAQQVKEYVQIRDVHRECAEKLFRPGVKGKDVFRWCEERQTALGCWHHRALLGHSIGIWVHEEPMLVANEDKAFQAGYLMVLEPRYFGYHLQDMFLITDNGPVLVSDTISTDEMYVVG